MIAYLRLLFWHIWYAITEWVCLRMQRCPVCWGTTIEHHVTFGGGLYECRLCEECFGLFAFKNITPEREEEEEEASSTVLPF